MGLWMQRRTRRFVISSHLPLAEAVSRLRADLQPGPSIIGNISSDNTVRVTLTDDAVKLVAARRGFANPWRPVVRGRFRSAGAGVQLACRFTWGYGVTLFMAVWFGGIVAALVLLAGAAVVSLVAGEPEQAGRPAVGAAITAGLLAAGAGMALLGEWSSRNEVGLMRNWLERRLGPETATNDETPLLSTDSAAK